MNKSLLYFFSTICGPCKQTGPIVDKLIEEGLNIRKVNVADNPEIAQRHLVKSVPNFVLIKDGRPIDQLVGAQNERTLKELLT